MAKVIKLAQPGYDVKTAGDANLIHNSNWPLLKIYMQGSATVTDFSQRTQLIVKHNLGYAPLFWYFTNNNITNWVSMPFTTDQRSDFQGITGSSSGEQLGVNSSELRFCSVDVEEVGGSSTVGPLKFYYYIFAINIEEAYTAPIINVGDQTQGGAGSKVFKISKPNSDVRSSKLEDYVVHSSARSPMIHSVNPLSSVANSGFVEGYGASVPHNLGYIPMFFGFRKGLITAVDNITHFPDTWFPMYSNSSSSITNFSADNNKIDFRTSINNRAASLVILKDPFNIKNKIDVQI